MVEMIKLCTGDFQLLLLFIAVVFVWWGKSHKDRQTDRQSNRQTDRQTEKEKGLESDGNLMENGKEPKNWGNWEKEQMLSDGHWSPAASLHQISIENRFETHQINENFLNFSKFFYKSMIRKIQKNSFVALNLEKMCKLAIKTSV